MKKPRLEVDDDVPLCEGCAHQKQADQDCQYCGGSGERFWHTKDCNSEFCCLAGGLDDCEGQIEACPCAWEGEEELA